MLTPFANTFGMPRSPARTMTKLSTSSAPSSTFLPVFALVAAMASLQLGASLAKSLFPLVGAQGTTVLRLLFSAIALLCFFSPLARLAGARSVAHHHALQPGSGWHELFVLHGDSHRTLGNCGSVGICRPLSRSGAGLASAWWTFSGSPWPAPEYSPYCP